jgi:hypothetical protein
MANRVRAAKGPRTKQTPSKKAELLELIRAGITITGACRRAKVGKSTFYEWEREDPTFKAEVAEAYEDGTDYLEDVMTERAVSRDTTALIVQLKARRPAKYREKYEVAGNISGTLRIEWGSVGAREETPSVKKAMQEEGGWTDGDS